MSKSMPRRWVRYLGLSKYGSNAKFYFVPKVRTKAMNLLCVVTCTTIRFQEFSNCVQFCSRYLITLLLKEHVLQKGGKCSTLECQVMSSSLSSVTWYPGGQKHTVGWTWGSNVRFNNDRKMSKWTQQLRETDCSEWVWVWNWSRQKVFDFKLFKI